MQVRILVPCAALLAGVAVAAPLLDPLLIVARMPLLFEAAVFIVMAALLHFNGYE